MEILILNPKELKNEKNLWLMIVDQKTLKNEETPWMMLFLMAMGVLLVHKSDNKPVTLSPILSWSPIFVSLVMNFIITENT